MCWLKNILLQHLLEKLSDFLVTFIIILHTFILRNKSTLKSQEMKFRLLLLITLPFLFVLETPAQKPPKKTEITGKVTDLSGNPVQGAIIMIDGQNTEKKTNGKGMYKIKVKPEVKRIGVFTILAGVKEESVEGRNIINFSLDKSLPSGKTEEELEETVDAGYAGAKKKDLSKPVTSTDVTGKQYTSFSSIYEMLRTIPGVQVSGSNVTVRGVQTTGSSSPMFVVNGTPVRTISNIDPSMVNSIEVLKGPSASVYGLEGANGVVLIKLK